MENDVQIIAVLGAPAGCSLQVFRATAPVGDLILPDHEGGTLKHAIYRATEKRAVVYEFVGFAGDDELAELL